LRGGGHRNGTVIKTEKGGKERGIQGVKEGITKRGKGRGKSIDIAREETKGNTRG